MPDDLPPPLKPASRTEVWFGRRRLAFFGGCDYLRLSSHPKVTQALCSVASDGIGVAASRRTTGNHSLYERLESKLARFFDAEQALLVSSGYATNLAVVQGLSSLITRICIDEKAHPSLVDAAQWTGVEVRPFRHCDPESLRSAARDVRSPEKLLVMTDGIFPWTGVAAPLAGYRAVLGEAPWILVDDCHAAGILGTHGRGSPEYHHISRKNLIQTITLSKAIGAFGGAILGDRTAIRRTMLQSRLVAGSTPPPLPVVAAAIESLGIIARSPAIRRQLHSNTILVKEALLQAGLLTEVTPGPMFTIAVPSGQVRDQYTERLLAQRVFPSFIQYPGGPAAGGYRFAISSEHSPDQLRRLIDALGSA